MTILNEKTLSNNTKLFIGIIATILIVGSALHFLGLPINAA